MSLISLVSLGLLLGMRHATDSDHVIAVSTMVFRGGGLRRAALTGVLWGAGHNITILLVGGAVILFRIAIPPRVGLVMEAAVAVTLIVLGRLSLSRRAHSHVHTHHAMRPFVVGVVHGLAGSAAVALLVLAAIRKPTDAIFYLLLFGIGTILGMVLITTAMAVPLSYAAPRFSGLTRWILPMSGALSLVFGVVLLFQIAFSSGLLTANPQWTPR
jgi:high-affinity nickel-transport protein